MELEGREEEKVLMLMHVHLLQPGLYVDDERSIARGGHLGRGCREFSPIHLSNNLIPIRIPIADPSL